MEPFFYEGFDDTSFHNRGWFDGYMWDIVQDDERGSVGMWLWREGATSPQNFSTLRNNLADDHDQFFIRFWKKYHEDWEGSHLNWHPHLIQFLSNVDIEELGNYASPANSYLGLYFESLAQLVEPYALRPLFAMQDVRRVNTDYGTPPQDITQETEYRSVNLCNGCLQGQDCGTSGSCYSIGSGNWYSSRRWRLQDTEIPKGQWSKQEYWIKMNSVIDGVGVPDGELKMWVDDVLVYESDNMLYRTAEHPNMAMKQLVLAPYIGSGSPVEQRLYIDDISIYSEIPKVEDGSAQLVGAPIGIIVY